MSQWKVFRYPIKLLDFPNPEVTKLQLGKIENYQIIVQKGLYKDGDIVVFVPEKSLLPKPIIDEYDLSKYLVGPLKNRVKTVKLQKEISCGIIIPDKPEYQNNSIGVNIAELLGITQYEVPIPAQLVCKVKPVGRIDTGGPIINYHDVEQLMINLDEFESNEEVLVTEKLHGSQCIFIQLLNGTCLVSSKGLLKRQLTLEEEDTNTYWRGIKNSQIQTLVNQYWPNRHVQVFGEVIPTQVLKYGINEPKIFIFRIDVDGYTISFDEIPDEFKFRWVPILYRGKIDIELFKQLRTGNETVSGKQLHIKEGIVVSPTKPRLFKDGSIGLYLKFLNPEYKETGEEFN